MSARNACPSVHEALGAHPSPRACSSHHAPAGLLPAGASFFLGRAACCAGRCSVRRTRAGGAAAGQTRWRRGGRQRVGTTGRCGLRAARRRRDGALPRRGRANVPGRGRGGRKVRDGRPRRCGLTADPPLYYLRSGSDWAFSLQDRWRRSEGHSVLRRMGDAKGRAVRLDSFLNCAVAVSGRHRGRPLIG